MKGKISWISPAQRDKEGRYYKTLSFAMLEGETKKPHTYLVMEFKNYENWKNFLIKGNILGGLEFVSGKPGLISADSPVYLIDGKFISK